MRVSIHINQLAPYFKLKTTFLNYDSGRYKVSFLLIILDSRSNFLAAHQGRSDKKSLTYD